MNQRLLSILFIGLFLSIISIAVAATVYTVVHFNVQSVVAFSVTLPDSSTTNSSGTSTSDIYFNCTDGGGNCADLEPCLTGGSNCQNISTTTPIFEYDNIGTVNIDLGIYFNTTLPSCITVYGNTTASCTGTPIANNQVTINSSFAPLGGTMKYYLCADFATCSALDETRQLTHNGTQV